MRMLKLTVAYDGAGYVGWQRQAEGDSIQGLLEEAIARVEGRDVTVTGAGRTDAGVHALGQVASVRVSSSIPCENYIRALNVALPPDVRVRRVEEVPDTFHARFDARRKTYRYRVLNAAVASPFEARYAWHVTFPLDVDAMRTALALCVGEHDFATFQGTGATVRDTIRTIERADITVAFTETNDPLLLITVTGTGFLRHMVRNIVGTLVEVGRGRWPPAELARIIIAKDRTQAGPTAPAQGLFLVEVSYEGDRV